MEKFQCIILFSTLMIITPMTSRASVKATTVRSLIEHDGKDNVDVNISQETPNSYLTIKTLKTILQPLLNIQTNVHESSTPEPFEGLTSNVNSIIHELNKIGINLYKESNINTMNGIIDFNTSRPTYIAGLHEDLKALSNIINDIDDLFENYFLEYLNDHVSNASLESFFAKILSFDSDSPRRSVFKLRRILFSKTDGQQDRSLLEKMVYEVNKRNSSFCSIRQTPQQFMYQFYVSLTAVQLKTYLMVYSAYKLRALQTSDDYSQDIEWLQNRYIERMQNYSYSFATILNKTSTELTACFTEPNDENHAHEIKMINKLPKESDYHNNKIVTGVRFVIKDGVLHLQIEEGKLIANGKISPGSDQWIPIDDINYHDRTINRNGQITTIRQCVDYHSVNSSDYWYINNIMAPPNFVVVGANLEVTSQEDRPDKSVYLRLKFVKVNITTAVLDVDTEKYSDNLSDVPPPFSFRPLSSMENYVYLKDEEIYEYQSYDGHGYSKTKSFFDTQAVYGEPRLPLLGVGTFNSTLHNQRRIKHNIISLKVFALDFSSIINDDYKA